MGNVSVTIIVYRNGVLASDSLVTDTSYDGRCGSCIKIATSRDGQIGGAAGAAQEGGVWLSWLRDGMRDDTDIWPLEAKEFEAIVVMSKNVVRYYNRHGNWDCTTAQYHAIGSGAPFALGAMAVGATAEEAVRAAIKHSIWCGGRVQVLNLT